MYATLANHLVGFIRYAISFVFIFVLFPRVIFGKPYRSFLDNIVSGYIKMVFLIIVLGYILTALKLFEVLTIFGILSFIAFESYKKRHSFKNIGEFITQISVLIYDYADGIIHPWRAIKNGVNGTNKKIKENIKRKRNYISGIFTIIIFTAIFIYSAYLRFYDAYIHAAPAMSDAYVTLAWMKYISGRVLFHDGIYPQGYHIYMAVLQKFAAIDPLYILRYTGPLTSIFIGFGLFYSVSRITGRFFTGIITAILFGIFGEQIFQGWIRQASTNSQEFGFVFIIPSFYFIITYIKTREKRDLITGVAGVMTAGLVHPIAFACAGSSMAVIVLYALIAGFKRNLRQVFKICLGGIAAILTAVTPLVGGVIAGSSFHQASQEFLTSRTEQVTFPQLHIFDYIALASLGVLFLSSLISIARRKRSIYDGCGLIFCGLIFLTYYAGGVVTQSTVIVARSFDIWAIVIPFVIGIASYRLLSILYINGLVKFLGLILCTGMIVYGAFYVKPSPIIPYKMEYDSSVEQYLRIRKMYGNNDWMIVSHEEGYAMVLGSGFHLMMTDFLNWYDPEEKQIGKWNNGQFEVLKTPEIFIYHQKKFFDVNMEAMKIINERKKKEEKEIINWIEAYSKKHTNISIFYEDEELEIFRIHQEIRD